MDIKERLINYIDERIKYFSRDSGMKSISESVYDRIFVEELKKMKKTINDFN